MKYVLRSKAIFGTLLAGLLILPSTLSVAEEMSQRTRQDMSAPLLVALFDCKSGNEVWRASSDAAVPPVKLAAGGFCELRGGNGNYNCEKGTCTGTCKFHNVPARCSCD